MTNESSHLTHKQSYGFHITHPRAHSHTHTHTHTHTVDATYEAVEKRTFLPMSIMVAMMLPFLVGLIVLYPQISRRESAPESESEEKKEPILEAANEEGATELTQLMTEKMEN